MIYNEDAVKWANEYTGEKFHALLCDAPYHLTSIVKRFGKKNSAPAQFGTDGVFSRSSKGFMGQTWDGGDVAFRPETWEAFGKVLYDGAFGMAFSASRNWHRMAVAIEDAGFIIHPTMFFLWINGQGFPKATRVKGDEVFDGHRYGLQALKPAVEPIIIFQKPYEGRPIDNIFATGAGALNIDGTRIPVDMNVDDSRLGGNGKFKTDKAAKHVYEGGYEGVDIESSPLGRWPANFVLDEESAKRLDKQTGIQKGGFVRNRTDGARMFNNNGSDTGYTTDDVVSEPDGGASRFFNKVSTTLDEADPFLYCGKVMPKERNAGLDEYEEIERRTMGTGMTGMSGDRSGKGKSTPIEMGVSKTRNPHPTLKPIELSKHLATLLLPPVEYAPRRLFVPFSGVASEMIGAYLAGWEEVVGVEFDTENGYVDIAKKRIQHWTGKEE